MATEAEKENAKLNLTHAREFTKIENGSGVHLVRGWIPESARQKDEIVRASDDVWALTILHEHFTSKLNENKGTRTETNLAIKAELERRAGAAIERLNALLPGDDEGVDEVIRINRLVDETASEVAAKFGL
jgi:hypothetical protein